MTQPLSLVAGHARGKKTSDAIFEAGRKAKEAAEKFGAAAVVNATMGTLQNESEQLAFMPTVVETLRAMAPSDFAAYSPFQGTPEFRAAIQDLTLGEFRPDLHVSAFATPGSTGALRNVVWNYLDVGQTLLVSDWHWSPYTTIAQEHDRRTELYRIFDEDRRFTLADLEQRLAAVLAAQHRAVVIINDPCQNPTGYDLSMDEWRSLRDLLFEAARRSGDPIVLVVDVPYIDYGSRGRENRAFAALFSGAPPNLLVTLAASISKSLGLYGLRTGALIGMSSDAQVLQEFIEVNEVSARGVWTNVPRAGMQLVTHIHRDAGLRAAVEREREVMRLMLVQRADRFLSEARDVALPLMPYRSGFFVTLPLPNSQAVSDALNEDNVFAVPMKMGLRVAISSVPAHKIPGLATRIARAIERVGAPR